MLIRITGPNNNKFISSVYRIDRTTQLLRGRQRICPSHAGMPSFKPDLHGNRLIRDGSRGLDRTMVDTQL
jgi:hypothetical protein